MRLAPAGPTFTLPGYPEDLEIVEDPIIVQIAVEENAVLEYAVTVEITEPRVDLSLGDIQALIYGSRTAQVTCVGVANRLRRCVRACTVRKAEAA